MDYKCEGFNEGEILTIHHKLSDIFRQYLPTFQVILMFYLIKNSQKKNYIQYESFKNECTMANVYK